MGAVSSIGVPDDKKQFFKNEFRQGLAEIEELARNDSQMGVPWDPFAVGRYNELIDENRVSHIEGMGLVSATTVATPALFRSIVEAVRTRALELALDLQSANPSAGEVGGPTTSDAAIRSALVQITNHIYGDGANVAQGADITQTSTITKGDAVELVKAVSALLKDPQSIAEAISIITGDAPDAEKRSKLEKIGKAIGKGAVVLATGVTTDMAAGRLLELAAQYLGW